jgi:hypothetical protein
MSLPTPEPGLVLSYSYLWKHQAQAGNEEGMKDRPCAVTLVIETSDTETTVWVAPITHTNPNDDKISIEIPSRVKNHLGLDNERSWIIINEVNVFVWPGPDLRPVPGNKGVFNYGFLPPKLYDQLREKMLSLYKTATLRSVKRSD